MANTYPSRTQFIHKNVAPRAFAHDNNTLFCGTRLCEPGHLFQEMLLIPAGEPVPDNAIRVMGIQLDPADEANLVPPTLAIVPSEELQEEWQRWKSRYVPDGNYLPNAILSRQLDGSWYVGLKQGVRFPTLTVGAISGDDLADALVAINAPVSEKQRRHQFPQIPMASLANEKLYAIMPSKEGHHLLSGVASEKGISWPRGLPAPHDMATLVLDTRIPDHVQGAYLRRSRVADSAALGAYTRRFELMGLDTNTLYIPLYTERQLNKRDAELQWIVPISEQELYQRFNNVIRQRHRGTETVGKPLPAKLTEGIEHVLSAKGLEPNQQLHLIKQELRHYPSVKLSDTDILSLRAGRVSEFQVRSATLDTKILGASPQKIAHTLLDHIDYYNTKQALHEAGKTLGNALERHSILQGMGLISALKTQDLVRHDNSVLVDKLFDRVKSELKQPFFDVAELMKHPELHTAITQLQRAVDHPAEQASAIYAVRDAISNYAELSGADSGKMAALAVFSIMKDTPRSQHLTWDIPITQSITPNAPPPKRVESPAFRPRW